MLIIENLGLCLLNRLKLIVSLHNTTCLLNGLKWIMSISTHHDAT